MKAKLTPVAKLLIVVSASILLANLVYTIWSGMNALGSENTSVASDYATFASATATIMLTLLTGFYTYSTRKLVEQTKRERELREQERVEDWYEDVISTTRLLIDRWEQEFAEPCGVTESGEPYIPIRKRKSFWEDIDTLADQLRKQISRHPTDANAEVVITAQDFYRELFLLQKPDAESEFVTYEGTLRTQLDDLLKKIKESSEQFGRSSQ